MRTFMRLAGALLVLLAGAPLAVAAGDEVTIDGAELRACADGAMLSLTGFGGQSTAFVSASSIRVTRHEMHRAHVAALGEVDRSADSPAMAANPIDFQSASADFTRFGRDLAIAVFPTEGEAPPHYTHVGSRYARLAHEPAGEVAFPRVGPVDAPQTPVEYLMTVDHVLFTPHSGVHELRGNFTMYVWDADFEVDGRGAVKSFKTGHSSSGMTGTATAEHWSWAVIVVRDGVLTLESTMPVDVRAVTFEVDRAGRAMEYAPRDGGLAAVPVTSAAAPTSATAWGASVADAATGLPAWALVVAGVATAAGLAVALIVRRRRRDAAAYEPGYEGFMIAGRDAIDRRDYVRALAWFDSAIAVRPRVPIAHVLRGITLEALGRHADAHEAFVAAVRAGPDDAQSYYHLARSLLWGGHAREAVQSLTVALASAPTLVARAQKDPSFAELRDHPQFLAIVGEL